MKKFISIFAVFMLAVIIFGTAACRERSVALPGEEPTATPSPTATPFTLHYDFEGSLNGWGLGGDPGFTAVNYIAKGSVPGSTVPSGNYCAAVTSVFTGTMSGEFEIVPVPNDLRQASTISVDVYIPAALPDAYSVQVFILGTAFAWHGTPYNVAALTNDAWNTVTLDLSSIAQADLSAVERVDVQLNSNGGGNWSGTFFVDNVLIQ